MGIDKFFEKFGLSKPEPDDDEAGVEAPPAEPAKKPAEPAEPAAKAARPVQPEAGSRGGNVVTLGGAGSSIHEGGSKPLHSSWQFCAKYEGGCYSAPLIG